MAFSEFAQRMEESRSLIEKSRYGFVDTNGKVVIEPRFMAVSDFAGGMAKVWQKESSKYGYIDVSGKFVIPYQFDEAMDFEAVWP